MHKKLDEYLDFPDLPNLVEEKIDDFSNTFGKKKDLPNFEIAKICAPPGCYTCHGNRELEAHFSAVKVDFENIRDFAQMSDPCQIFYIGRKNSSSRLGISRPLFEELYRTYGIFPSVWDYILPFGFKSRGSDMGQAACKFRQNESIFLPSRMLGSFECAYGFSYTKLNGRRNLMNENPDYDPWSIRQVAVYQQYNSMHDRLTFILVAPSDEIRTDLEQEIVRLRRLDKRLNAFALHFIILYTLHENWGLYLRDLGNILKTQSETVMLKQVRSETDSILQSPDLPVTFLDRQRLQLIEDKILDLVVVFESFLDTISRLKLQCQKHCKNDICIDCTCTVITDDFEYLEHDVRLNLKKADTLYRRAQGTTKLLTNLLDFENAQIANTNEKSLNKLVTEAKDENAKMMILAERSTRDAAAVRILTVITLIYLPMTVVASFFSSQLIQVSESGRVSVVAGAWWFAAISIPLTAATFLVWKLWLFRSLKAREKKMKATTEAEKPITRLELWHHGIKWSATSAGQFMLALRKREKRENFGSGNAA